MAHRIDTLRESLGLGGKGMEINQAHLKRMKQGTKADQPSKKERRSLRRKQREIGTTGLGMSKEGSIDFSNPQLDKEDKFE